MGNCGCQYDGGDCCAKTLGKPVSKKYCKICKCLDPKGKSTGPAPKAPACDKTKNKCGAATAKYKGDGNCDDENNNCGCDYDGGDCCAKTAKGGKVKTQYCKDCKCLDPKVCDGKCKF